MAGIYLHIPFCSQACHYCNFHFSTSLKGKNDFVAALLKEISLQQGYIGGEAVETIYFGGGTPSLLKPSELQTILDGLQGAFHPPAGVEITLEANPDDMTVEKLRAWKAAGINRLSIGVQSFFEEDLRWMNRAHNASQAMECIGLAKDEGFTNISIDLIYGGPTLPDLRWKKNVEQALAWEIPHLSCYAMTVEPRTALDKMIRMHTIAPVDPDAQARQFLLLMDWLGAAGYEQYEISNFSLPGLRSRHNSSYWQGKKYLGLGPSAHSFDGASRQWNVANNAQYARSLLKGELLFEKEDLTKVQQLNEYIMISLRTLEGADLAWLAQRFGTAEAQDLRQRAERYIREGKMVWKEERLALTKEGKLLADGIAADLFL